MKRILISLSILSVGLFGQDNPTAKITTRASQMEPRIAKPGTVITITGAALGKSKVEEVYLTDHRFDMKVKVLEQSDDVLKIRVPPHAKPGRQQLLVLTSGDNAAYLEMPLYLTIEAEEEAASAEPMLKTVARSYLAQK